MTSTPKTQISFLKNHNIIKFIQDFYGNCKGLPVRQLGQFIDVMSPGTFSIQNGALLQCLTTYLLCQFKYPKMTDRQAYFPLYHFATLILPSKVVETTKNTQSQICMHDAEDSAWLQVWKRANFNCMISEKASLQLAVLGTTKKFSIISAFFCYQSFIICMVNIVLPDKIEEVCSSDCYIILNSSYICSLHSVSFASAQAFPSL